MRSRTAAAGTLLLSAFAFLAAGSFAHREQAPRTSREAALLVAAASPLRTAPVRVGARAPHLFQASADRPTVVWVFEGRSLLSCRSAAYALRHVRRAFGDRVAFRAVAVEADRVAVSSFFRAERLPFQGIHVTTAEFNREIAGTPDPRLYVIDRGGAVLGVVATPSREVSDSQVTSELRTLLGSVLAPE